MSLDVYLNLKGVQHLQGHTAIFIRECGSLREVSRAEWDRLHPDRDPVTVDLPDDDETVYEANITHNLNRMAGEAGIYEHLWRPSEIGITKAKQLIEPLRAGVAVMKQDPSRFEQHNPKNGWGSYEAFVPWVERYLEACESYPEAVVEVSI